MMLWGIALVVASGSIAEAIDPAALFEKLGYGPLVATSSGEVDRETFLESARSLVIAREAAASGDYQEAVNGYQAALIADPGNEAAWKGLAELATEHGDASAAAYAWKKRLELSPEDAFALGVVAEEALDSGDRHAALGLLLRRAQLDSSDDLFQAIRWDAVLASLLYEAGETQSADLALDQMNKGLASLIARDDVSRGDRQKWGWLMQRLVHEAPPDVARDAAAMRLQAGNLNHPADIARMVSACMALDASTGNGQSTVELIESLTADQYRVRMAFRELLTLAEIWQHAGVVHDMLGNKMDAEAMYRRALQLDPQSPLALNNLGYMLLERGEDLSAAAELIERAVLEDPESVEALDSLGLLRLEQGKLEDTSDGPGSLTLLRAAVRQTDQLSPQVLLHLGDAEAAAGQIKAARSTWRHGLALLEHPRFRAVRLRELDRIQREQWGLRVIPTADLYDLEFGGVAAILRSRLIEESVAD
ncbi:MAG: tetratricopeptide repeat protein [Phycisphaerales bacterium]|nr:tetratricopeptide repeat protein [Phycisphaerales bacterium]